MHRNPVIRGLVERPEDWRWSSYRHYLLDQPGPVEISRLGRRETDRAFARWTHLIDDRTVAKMGHPIVVVPSEYGSPSRTRNNPAFRTPFPTFPPRSTPICTTSAPCSSRQSRLPSNDALLLTGKPTDFAPFRENPQPKPLFFAPPGHLPPVNTGIRTGNTTCCALYLTHPTEGVIFTTATPQRHFVRRSFL
jgi:hypothetical protein